MLDAREFFQAAPEHCVYSIIIDEKEYSSFSSFGMLVALDLANTFGEVYDVSYFSPSVIESKLMYVCLQPALGSQYKESYELETILAANEQVAV